ncbi:hypothetical protein, partial [Pseudomonas sp. MWU12-2323]|uniref:hypothetical protein n=1 Tax=Pseudomonas sp. MWU12-2323 TaxID=2651296 RepID=UPI001C49C2E0
MWFGWTLTNDPAGVRMRKGLPQAALSLGSDFRARSIPLDALLLGGDDGAGFALDDLLDVFQR